MDSLKRMMGMIVILANFLPLCVYSQTAPPGTDIYVASISMDEGTLSVSTPTNITNRPGYDNQPYFLPDGTGLLYTSLQEDSQTDIFRYDFNRKVITRVTETRESEYSPTIMPDGKFFSTVRVELDTMQRLWKFPIGGGKPVIVLEHVKPVGYHAWGNENTVALFVLGDPPTLQIADSRTGKAERILGGVGRSLHKIPKMDAISFVHKMSEEEWLIKQIELKSRKIMLVVKALPKREDYAWTPGGTILMADGPKLFQFMPGKDENWREIADFSNAGLLNITRIAVSPSGGRVALVADYMMN
ncbi:MAG: hypothetical protein V3U73_05745 [bacterium]